MNDLTEGPVAKHVVRLAAFIAMSTAFQTLYFLADLYFVGRLGKEAIAGVGLAGNLMFLVLALTQSLGVGTTSLIAQALGAKDKPRAERVFNQALALSTLTGIAFGSVVFALRGGYARWLAADAATAAAGLAYLDWFLPALFLQFPMIAMGAALRGMGDVKIPTLIQVVTVLINIVLAPTLMFGWIGGRPLGVAGTAIASLIAVGVGCLAFAAYFRRPEATVRFHREDWTPDLSLWGQILKIGVPAGGEFALMSVYMVLVYSVIRPFGAAAQAGFGIGIRLMQSLFLPVVAIAFATAPVVGQNYGARLGERVRQAYYTAAGMSVAVMLVLIALCHISPAAMVGIFNRDPEVVAVGSEYLRIISWNFVASGLVFVSSSVFQGIGNTLPSLASSCLRLFLFALPTYFISQRPGFELKQVWYLSVTAVAIQVVVNLLLLHREIEKRLPAAIPAAVQPIASAS